MATEFKLKRAVEKRKLRARREREALLKKQKPQIPRKKWYDLPPGVREYALIVGLILVLAIAILATGSMDWAHEVNRYIPIPTPPTPTPHP